MLMIVPYLSMMEVNTCLRTPNTCTSRLLRHNQLWCGDLTWQWLPRKPRTRSPGRSEPQPWCSFSRRYYLFLASRCCTECMSMCHPLTGHLGLNWECNTNSGENLSGWPDHRPLPTFTWGTLHFLAFFLPMLDERLQLIQIYCEQSRKEKQNCK